MSKGAPLSYGDLYVAVIFANSVVAVRVLGEQFFHVFKHILKKHQGHNHGGLSVSRSVCIESQTVRWLLLLVKRVIAYLQKSVVAHI